MNRAISESWLALCSRTIGVIGQSGSVSNLEQKVVRRA
jgi:hypothetical protein